VAAAGSTGGFRRRRAVVRGVREAGRPGRRTQRGRRDEEPPVGPYRLRLAYLRCRVGRRARRLSGHRSWLSRPLAQLTATAQLQRFAGPGTRQRRTPAASRVALRLSCELANRVRRCGATAVHRCRTFTSLTGFGHEEGLDGLRRHAKPGEDARPGVDR
jgi:hypothetical protein